MRTVKALVLALVLALVGSSCVSLPKMEIGCADDKDTCELHCAYIWADCLSAGGQKELCGVMQLRCLQEQCSSKK